MISSANWIKTAEDFGTICPVFIKEFDLKGTVKVASMEISCMGTYKAFLNGALISDFIMAPGFTSYKNRLQYQSIDLTSLLAEKNSLHISVGNGWCVGRLGWEDQTGLWNGFISLIASIRIEYQDGSVEEIRTDESWKAAKGPVLFSEVYDGETYDSNCTLEETSAVACCDLPKSMLIPQEGEVVREIQSLAPIAFFVTPEKDQVIDFGQNLTGYVQFGVQGEKGHICEVEHAEVLDKNGNFYIENLRTAKQKITYTCNGSRNSYKPMHTFQGFRYIRLKNWPEAVDLSNFKAIVVCSDMKRTGNIETSSPKLNKLFENVIWGQKGNFVDIPTDCPQRDERLGWTGDAQVFIKTASYNFNVDKFFTKWLRDLKADQFEDGGLPAVIPNALGRSGACSSAWGDAATVCPWQLYLTYGNVTVLEEQFESMKKWVEYIRAQSQDFIWCSGHHFGDWLGLDAPYGSCKGSTDEALIATAFFAYSTSLLVKAGEVLKKEMGEYNNLYTEIVKAYKEKFILDNKLVSNTQTAHVLTLFFKLCDNKEEIAANLAKLIHDNGDRLTTGFVGTPYLLHALSQNGYAELAYTLLMQEQYPSWLFSVNMGATTIWEHWDGINDQGEMWSKSMNSFNHYAYGSVADWMYEVAAGIHTDEKKPGFEHVLFKPIPDQRLQHFKAQIETKNGLVASSWRIEGKQVHYQFTVPKGTTATIQLSDFPVAEGQLNTMNATYEVESGVWEYSQSI